MDGSFTATYDVEVSWMDAPGDPGEMIGTVWEDFNYNGVQDEITIVGVAGIQVNVTSRLTAAIP